MSTLCNFSESQHEISQTLSNCILLRGKYLVYVLTAL